MARKWQVLGRHKWVLGATITESALIDSDDGQRRYTATIRGWRNWRIWQGATAYQEMKPRTDAIINQVKEIRDRIDAGDPGVFQEAGAW